jgi:TolB protein
MAHGQSFAFQRDEGIAISDLADVKGSLKKLGKGTDPCISPDGSKVAFTQSDAAGDRRIAIYDLAQGKATLVKGVPGKNEFMPIWTPDGKRLFFNHFGESDWVFAGVDAAGGNFQTINKETTRKVAGAASMLKGEEWLCHDMEAFYVLKVSGESIGKVRELPKTEDVTSLSMPSWLAVSPDGKTALFDRGVEAEADAKDGYVPNAIFQLDLATGKVSRVTPKGVEADHPSWLPGGTEFLFGGFDKKADKSAIYRMAVAPGSSPVLVLADASSPSVALSETAVSFQTVTYVNCIYYTGSAQLVFKDDKGAEVMVGVMTKAQRTGMAPDEPYVKFPEAMIDTNAKDGSHANAKMVGKKFRLVKDAAGEVLEVNAVK